MKFCLFWTDILSTTIFSLILKSLQIIINSTRPFHSWINRIAKSQRKYIPNPPLYLIKKIYMLTSLRRQWKVTACGQANSFDHPKKEKEKEEKIGKDGRLNMIQRLAMYAPKPTGLLFGSGNSYSTNRTFSIISIHGQYSSGTCRHSTWKIPRRIYVYPFAKKTNCYIIKIV